MELLSLISGDTAFAGHPVVSLTNGQITGGSLVTATDLVLQSGALGNLNTLKAGNAFLTQLHDDLSALLDAELTQSGDAATITGNLLQNIKNRLGPALGIPGTRPTGVLALVLDPVSLDFGGDAGRNARLLAHGRHGATGIAFAAAHHRPSPGCRSLSRCLPRAS